jgi:hypothetical protein
MSMVGACIARDTTAAFVVAHSWGDRRSSVCSERAPQDQPFFVQCMSPKVAQLGPLLGGTLVIGSRSSL